ncbi:MAG TPA: YdcF family protein [Anaerolineae bacterium]|nr:YdcF family protein [Anaerolineae bacterium]
MLAIILIALVVVIDQFGFSDRSQRADVIVLLGSMVYPGGKLGPSLERRAEHAVALYQAGLADHIICSGGVGDNPPAEARVACGRVIDLGVPAAAIFYEENSHSTEENAAYTAAIMREHGWQTALIDTDGFHLLRATLMFQRAGVVTYPSPAQITAGPMNPIERLAREAREAAGLIYFGAKVALGVDITSR